MASCARRRRYADHPQATGDASRVLGRRDRNQVSRSDGHPLEFFQFPRGAKSGWQGTGLRGSTTAQSRLATSRRVDGSMRIAGRRARSYIQSGPGAGRARRSRWRPGRRPSDKPREQDAAYRVAGIPPPRRQRIVRWPSMMSPPRASSVFRIGEAVGSRPRRPSAAAHTERSIASRYFVAAMNNRRPSTLAQMRSWTRLPGSK